MPNAYAAGGSAQAAIANVKSPQDKPEFHDLAVDSYSNKDVIVRMLGYIGSDLLIFVLSLFANIVAIGLSLYIPILIGKAMDDLVSAGITISTNLFHILSSIAVFALASAIASWLANFAISYVSAKTIEKLRVMAFGRFKSISISFTDTHAKGDLMGRVIADIDAVGDGLVQGLSQLSSGVVSIICTIYFMLQISLPITIILLILSPLSMILAGFISKFSHRSFREQQAIQGSLSANAEEAIYAHDLLQAFNYTDQAKDSYGHINQKLYSVGEKAQFISSLTNPSTRLVNNICYACVAFFGISSIVSGRFGNLSIGQVQSFLVYANQYMRPFNEISSVAIQIESAFASARRLLALLDADTEVADAKDALKLSRPQGEISLSHVSFSYTKEKEILHDITLDIKAGERVALVGPTGCGKTTLLSLLLRFYEADSGKICLDGHNIKSLTKESLRASFAMVLQDSWLFEGTILDNIRFGKAEATREEVIAAAKRAHADGFIQQLPDGYNTYFSPENSSLSQGQKQLLCIARVMLADPAVLLLDEATSNIDTRTEQQVQAAFDEMMKNRTSLVVAHRLSTIYNSDRIVVMDQGKIIEIGSHSELMEKKGFYYKLYMRQFAQAKN